MASGSDAAVPLHQQQLALDIFKNAFSTHFNESLKEVIQEVKGRLYELDWDTAFGNERYLEAYALRWSPSRALHYIELFRRLSQHVDQKSLSRMPLRLNGRTTSFVYNVTCFGGGAGAEIVGLAGMMNCFRRSEDSLGKNQIDRCAIKLVDRADWSNVVQALERSLVNPPPLSNYASTAAKAKNTAFIPRDTFELSFHQQNLLDLSPTQLKPLLDNVDLVTLMFTLNELYTDSVPRTTELLLTLNTIMKKGALLLVVGSADDQRCSTVSIGKNKKPYPVQWLLDHTLRETAQNVSSNGEIGKWQQVTGYDSQWLRLSSELMYPIALEDMRHQMRLYRLV
ncbi:MAG: hypothetical protein M1833_001135 [Piccolia ochrophora]|nr:MAG: hypothetical protein M1833_001135 [Piccolia ochrophora]